MAAKYFMCVNQKLSTLLRPRASEIIYKCSQLMATKYKCVDVSCE